MNTDYEIIVVGAGPAGSMAAFAAASAGRRVCLVERKPVVGTPVRCGEGVGKKGMSQSIALKPEWIKSRISSIGMIAPDGTQVTLKHIDESYILDREVMDKDLADMAVSAGAQILLNTTVLRIIKKTTGTYHCYTENGMHLTAPCVILADGVESRLARDVGFDTVVSPEDMETCAFTRVYNESIDDTTCLFFTGSQVAPGGFTWVFPRGRGCANVGLGIIGSKSSAGKAVQLLEDFLAKHYAGSRYDPIHCGGVPVAKWLKPLVIDGIMVAGDAAHQVCCYNGGGIAYALIAGKMAGSVAARAFLKKGFSKSRLKKYQRLWAARHGKQQLRSYAVKKMLVSWDDSFFNEIAASLAKEDPAKLNYLRVFTRTFSRHPFMLLKVLRLFS